MPATPRTPETTAMAYVTELGGKTRKMVVRTAVSEIPMVMPSSRRRGAVRAMKDWKAWTRSRRTAAKERKLKVQDQGLKELLSVITRLMAQVANKTRTLWSIVSNTVIVPADSKVAQEMRAEAKNFHETVETLKDNVKKAESQRETQRRKRRSRRSRRCAVADRQRHT